MAWQKKRSFLVTVFARRVDGRPTLRLIKGGKS
jgi:hypothetical protein